MAIEAVTQHQQQAEFAPEIVGYSFRSVAINSTMQVPDDEFGIETILNLQAYQLTTSKSSDRWFEFTISSLQNDQWTEHCQGLICTETERKSRDTELFVDSRSRHVESISWYEKFAEVGLGYGPSFAGLTDINVHPDRNSVSAAVALHTTRGMVKGRVILPHPSFYD